MTSPHLVPTVITPRKPKGTKLLEDVFLNRTGFELRHFRGDDINRGLLHKVFSACFPMPLEEFRGSERACNRGFYNIWLPHTDNLRLYLIIQRRRGR